VKWLLILFLGIIVVPVFAQNITINQTDYQKLETSISGLHVKLHQLNTSITGLQIEQQQLNKSVYGLHTDHVQYDSKGLVFTGLTFFGGILVAIVIGFTHFNEIKKQNKLIDDTRSVYAKAYVSWVQLIINNFKDVIRWYDEEYLNQPVSQRRENFRRNLIDHYERDLLILNPQIEIIELVKVFGKKIADKVWASSGHMRAEMWQPYDDNGMKLMIEDYKKLIKKAIDLKDTFLPFCDKSMKIKDQELKELYDKIKATE